MIANVSTLLGAWNLEFAAVDDSCKICGSPERTVARMVVSDRSGKRWILERVSKDNAARKQWVARQLRALHHAGLLCTHPWARTGNKAFVHDNWMVRPFVEGLSLNRQTYLNELWRVDAMADFLIQLRHHSSAVERGPVFSIANYAVERMESWMTRYPKLSRKLAGSLGQLEHTFFPFHDQLPVAFCHGDYHPLNMIWGAEKIRSVIDWEFCGLKPELYDVALLLGCFGFDDPDHLIQEPAVRLIKRLRKCGLYEDASWAHLAGLIATIRIGWMNEWIRRGDEEAVEMEADFIDILVDQQVFILEKWQ